VGETKNAAATQGAREMSVLVLDENLHVEKVCGTLAKHFSVLRLPDLKPGEHVLDDRVPTILLELDRPTLITIDQDFWDRKLCHPSYGIMVFNLEDDEQPLLPDLLRALFRQSEFATRAARMGKVARVSRSHVEYWEFGTAKKVQLFWK